MWRLSCARICQLFSNRWTRECTLENVFYCCCFYRTFSVHIITEPWLLHELLRCTSFSWILICGPFSPVKPWVKSRSDCRAHTLFQLLGGGVTKRSLPQAWNPYLAIAMISLSCVQVLLQNVKFGTFTSLSCIDGNEMYKKAWCTCRVVDFLI